MIVEPAAVTDSTGLPLSAGDAIRISGLTKQFGAIPMFDGFDLTVRRGSRLAILGASGCGKSTLLRCIAGLDPLQAGRIAVAGELGFVFQEPRLFPWLSVEANVRFATRNARERQRIDEVIELVGLTSARDRLPKHLSGGMAQRAALARTLVRNPDVILLDEPLAALDALRRLELRAALRDIVIARGATAILVTHDVDEALAVGDRFMVLERTASGIRALEPVGATTSGAREVLLAALGVRSETGRTG